MSRLRQKKILEIISKEEVTTQQELVSLLKERGFDVTQSTVSRDIRNLKLNKVMARSGKYKYAIQSQNSLPIPERSTRILKTSVTSFTASKNLLVLHTIPAYANVVAKSVDDMAIPHIIGTISGYDTILLIVDDEKNTDEVLSYINNIMIARNLK